MADENLQSTKIVKVTGTLKDNNVTYVLMGGSGVDQVTKISYSVDNDSRAAVKIGDLEFTEPPAVGDTDFITEILKGDRIILIGHFDDGTE